MTKLTPEDHRRIRDVEDRIPYHLARQFCADDCCMSPGTECPYCGDIKFAWWALKAGTGVICDTCGWQLIVYARFSQYYTSSRDEDISALQKALQRARKHYPTETP